MLLRLGYSTLDWRTYWHDSYEWSKTTTVHLHAVLAIAACSAYGRMAGAMLWGIFTVASDHIISQNADLRGGTKSRQ